MSALLPKAPGSNNPAGGPTPVPGDGNGEPTEPDDEEQEEPDL